MFSPNFHDDFGLVFGVLGHLHIVQRNGAVLVEILGALQLGSGQNLIRYRLPVGRIAARHIVAANGHQQLALLHGIAEARVNGHDASRGEGDDRDVAGNVGSDCPRDDQLRSRGFSVAAASGNCSGWSTVNSVESPTVTTFGGGGAPAAATASASRLRVYLATACQTSTAMPLRSKKANCQSFVFHQTLQSVRPVNSE